MTKTARATRKSWSRELILDAAFRIVDASDTQALTMSRLGRELDADPSALYRHFRNKDELLRAMGDAVYAEVAENFEPSDDPIENLRRMAWLTRVVFLKRPVLASTVAARFTGGPAEADIGETMVASLEQLGFDRAEANRHSRALGELYFGHILITAAILQLTAEQRAIEMEIADRYPARLGRQKQVLSHEEQIAESRAECDVVFDSMLETFLTGLAAVAPLPGR